MARSKIPHPRGGTSRHGANSRTANVSVRVPWDLHARLQARAHALGCDKSEAIRRAIAQWLASDPEIRTRQEDFDLVKAVAAMDGCSTAEAKVKIRLGLIVVNGRVERRFALPPGPAGHVLEIRTRAPAKHTPNSRG
jgi:predicted transcriptional regulator